MGASVTTRAASGAEHVSGGAGSPGAGVAGRLRPHDPDLPGATGRSAWLHDADQIQLVRLDIPGAQVGDPERVFRMQIDIRDRIAAISGVASASFTSSAPMEPFNDNDALLAEDHSSAKGQIPPIRRFKFVSPGFFQTVGTPLVAGRDLTWTEVNHHRPIAVISENLARELWGPAAALGKRIRENPIPGEKSSASSQTCMTTEY